MSRSLKLVSLAAIISAVLVAEQRSADACSCVRPVLADQLENSAAVFVATAVERIEHKRTGKDAKTPAPFNVREVEYRFSIDRAFKGDVKETVSVFTGPHSAGCGSNFEIKSSYVIYASERDGRLQTGLCSGNELATPEVIAKIEAALGGGEPTPDPDPEPTPDPNPEPPPPSNGSPPPVAKGNPACGGCASTGASGAGSTVLVGLCAFIAFARRRRR